MTDDADPQTRELAQIPATEVILRAAVMLMSAAAEKLGLGDDSPATSPNRDLDEARKLIDTLAGLVMSAKEHLGLNAAPLRDALKSLQQEFRAQSAFPDAPGSGPGEKLTGPVAQPAR